MAGYCVLIFSKHSHPLFISEQRNIFFHCTWFSPILLTSYFALHFIQLCFVSFCLTDITKTRLSPFACGESWTLTTRSLWATCNTRNQTGGGQPLNHRITLSKTVTHSFDVLQKHSGPTLNLAVKMTRRSAHSCCVSSLCIFVLKKPLELLFKRNDVTELQLMGTRKDIV